MTFDSAEAHKLRRLFREGFISEDIYNREIDLLYKLDEMEPDRLSTGDSESGAVTRLVTGIDRPIGFLCIGTPQVLGDAYGPLVGTFLDFAQAAQRYGVRILGNVADPITFSRVAGAAQQLRKDPPDIVCIAIDAMMDRQCWVGKTVALSGPILPGRGAGNDGVEVGDYSIVAVVSNVREGTVGLSTARPDTVMEMARMTAGEILAGLELRAERLRGYADRLS